MPQIDQSTVRNRLLRALSPDQFRALAPGLEPIGLPRRLPIGLPGVVVDWAVFPEQGLVSVVADSTGRQLEVGLIGREGVAPVAVVLGADRTPLGSYVQVPGHGHRVPARVLQDALDEMPALRALLNRYVQGFIGQIAQTALVNGTCTIEQRLARWILMVHDRSDGDDMSLTHEFLSVMLGVRRTGVTLAMHMLESEGMIKARRGLITVRDRAKLIAASHNGYGPAEAEYERLMGVPSGPD